MSRAAVWLAVVLALTVSPSARQAIEQPDVPGTFSILGYDPDTGEIGGAVQSRVFSVGNGVLWAEAEVGVAATQAIVDVSYGPQALALLRAGLSPAAIVKAILESDPDPGHNDVVLRLQVDDNPEPLTELRRLVEMNARRFRPRQ